MIDSILIASAVLLAVVISVVLLIIFRRERAATKSKARVPRNYLETPADKTMVISREEVDAMLKKK
ncbi:MAG TPA: hypothetical protein VMV91_16480 [Rhodocyclaceae bacterium]|nr:hypothetical protein [Rhodocyclaceae bacterium]